MPVIVLRSPDDHHCVCLCVTYSNQVQVELDSQIVRQHLARHCLHPAVRRLAPAVPEWCNRDLRKSRPSDMCNIRILSLWPMIFQHCLSPARVLLPDYCLIISSIIIIIIITFPPVLSHAWTKTYHKLHLIMCCPMSFILLPVCTLL